MNFLNLFGKHEIDAWRDDYTLAAASILNEVAADLIASFEEDFKAASWKDGLVGQNAFIARSVNPRIHEMARPLIDHIVAEGGDVGDPDCGMRAARPSLDAPESDAVPISQESVGTSLKELISTVSDRAFSQSAGSRLFMK